MNKLIYTLVLAMMAFGAQAQEAAAQAEPQMADLFRQEGKIYIVITVLSIVFVSLIVYLVSIDLKLRKLEKKN